MAPVLQKGLFCCLSLRTCTIILGSIHLVSNLLTFSMFVIGLDNWLGSASQVEHEHEHEHENATGSLMDEPREPREHMTPEDYFDGIDDSQAMEELVQYSHMAVIALWFDFMLVVLETVSIILLLWGAAKRIGYLVLPWLAVGVITTLYDVGFFAYLFAAEVYIAIDLMPIVMLPVTIYCWLVVFSFYQECRETASRNAAVPLSMSALEAGQDSGACTVPYGRMVA